MNGRLSISLFLFALALSLISCDSTTPDGLPPDPGEEGTQTLAGIDSDGDGVRDDVQRLIYLNYEDEAVRSSLVSLAKAAQDAILQTTSGQNASGIRADLSRSVDCLVIADDGIAPEALNAVIAAMVNTPDRSDAYVIFNVESNGVFEELSTTAEATCSNGTVVPFANVHASDRRAVVIFSNGMLNDWPKAHLNTRMLEWTMQAGNGLPSGYEDTRFTLVYNPNGIAAFLVAPQLAGATYGRILEILASGEWPDWLEEWFESAILSIDEIAYAINDDLKTQVQYYRTLLDQGQKVVLVGHSQGNFYANQSCRLLGSPSLGVVGVATPATQVCNDDQPYTTLYNDAIINLIARTASWLVLPPNTVGTTGTIKGHSFIEDYLEGGNAGPRIVDHVSSLLLSLVQPGVTIGSGPITVSLEWGAEPDVDLHVFEPDGTQVYYANLKGTFGTLDRDDVDGFGPENYHVPEATLGEGVYWIGVNYYRGDNPEVARIQITTAGTTYQAILRELLAERGPSGNSDPIPVAEIEVVRIGSEYSYTVREVDTPPLQSHASDFEPVDAVKARHL